MMQQRKEERREEGAAPVRTAVETAAREARSGWLSTVFSAAPCSRPASACTSAPCRRRSWRSICRRCSYYVDGEGENFTFP